MLYFCCDLPKYNEKFWKVRTRLHIDAVDDYDLSNVFRTSSIFQSRPHLPFNMFDHWGKTEKC